MRPCSQTTQTNKRIQKNKTTNTQEASYRQQKQIIRKRFSKQRNAVSEPETIELQELYKLKYSINKNHQINDQLNFFDSETTSHSSKKGKRRMKKSYTNKPYAYTIGINQ